ncbi:Lsr2 family protein, partial [Kibdelosporangium lantanae]
MAQKVTVELVDDLDGTVAEDISTVTFGLDGVAYEIDLTVGNAEKLRKLLDDFVGGARRTGGRAKRPASVQG